MLDRSKLVHDLRKRSDILFPDNALISSLMYEQWEKICKDPSFFQRAEAAQSSFLVPLWRSPLNETYGYSLDMTYYTVIAVDGSQIYPDRHLSGARCFLVNIGGCLFSYGSKSSVSLFSHPSVLIPQEIMAGEDVHVSPDIVDLKRNELELRGAMEKLEQLSPNVENQKVVCLFDGTLIFWSLESKPLHVKDYFLQAYCRQLEYFYKRQIPAAWYISFPKSKELINLIKLSLCRFTVANCIPCHSAYTTFPCKVADVYVDTMIMKSFLPLYHRTIVFMSTSKITYEYPEHLRPYFFYINLGKEIARIEVPAWVAENADYLDRVCKVAIDQSIKGNGYPISLAEAHEQAVIKGDDRDFFFHVICKIGVEHNKRVIMSQKNIKKRGMGI